MKHLCTLFLLVIGLSGYGVEKYVVPHGTGDGTSWDKAGGTNLVNSLGGGDTLWLAGGDYGNGFAITVSGNATSPVTVKKATAASHGSESGWQSSYDSQAVFRTGIGVSGRYVTLDGNEWKPPGLPVKYGILIHHASGQKGVDAGGSPGNLTCRNLAIAGPGINASKAEADGIHFTTNSLISGCAVYDTDALLFCWKGNSGTTIEYCYLYNASSDIVFSGNPQSPHPDVTYSGSGWTSGTLRWSLIANVTSEGCFFDQEGPGDNMVFYGNIMFQGDCQTGNTPIQFQNGASFGKVLTYHNTFVDFNKSNIIGPGTTLGSGSAVVNNLFINYLPNWPVGVDNNGFSSTGIGSKQIVNANSPFVTTGQFKWVKGSGVPPATRVTSGAPAGYDPAGMETAFALADNSWAKGKAIAVPAGYNVDLYGRSNDSLGALASSGGSAPAPSPSATPPVPSPSPSATPPPVGEPKFKVGDAVTVKEGAELNVRSEPAGAVLGVHRPGDLGQVKAGPVIADLKTMVNWYEVLWGTDPKGPAWSGEDDMVKSSTPAPTPTPPQPTPSPSATPPPVTGPTYNEWAHEFNKAQADWVRAHPPVPDQ